MDEIPDPTRSPPRHRRWWIAVAITVALAVAIAAGFVLVRSPMGPVVSTAFVVFLQPDAGVPQKAEVAGYVQTLDIVGEATLQTHVEAYNQVVQLYDGGEVPESVKADSVLESYRYRLAASEDLASVMRRLRAMPSVRDVIVPGLLQPSPPPFDEGRATELVVFLKQDASHAQQAVIEAYLRSLPTVSGVVFRTRAQTYQALKAMFPGRKVLTTRGGVENLPEAFVLSLVDSADIDPAIAHLRSLPGVDAATAYVDRVHR